MRDVLKGKQNVWVHKLRHGDILEDHVGNKKSNCDGELEYLGECYRLDVFWYIFRCRKCNREIWTVEGRPHWWNFEVE